MSRVYVAKKGDNGGMNCGDKKVGMFQKIMNKELKQIMQEQLDLQVDISFDRHYDFLRRNGLGSCKSVLDIGTGNGYFCCRLAQKHPQILFTGIDLKEDMVQSAEKKAQALNVSNNTRWILDDVSNDNFLRTRNTKEMFDGILLRYVDGHISDFEKVLLVAKGLLKHGGQLWIFTMELDHMYSCPKHNTFDLYKRATEHLYKTFGIDGHRGSKLPSMLTKACYQVDTVELDPMSNKDFGTEKYQRFMLHEARLIKAYDPQALSREELEEIGRFVEEVVPSPEYYGTFGVVMISSHNS